MNEFKYKPGSAKVGRFVGISFQLTVPFEVEFPCGNKYKFESIKNIPKETTICRCNDSNHLVVEYEDITT
jgi:hypothetical protein